MKEKLKNKVASALAIGILFGGILAVISVIAIFGGGIMRLLGFTYQSVGNIILYFIIFGVVGFPAEILAKAFPRALLSLGKLNKRQAKFLFVMLDTAATAFVMGIVDFFMDSVSATVPSVLAVAFLLALWSAWDFNEKLPKDE